MYPVDLSSSCVGHLVTAAAQPDPEQCEDLGGIVCKKYPRKIILLSSFLVFPELYFQRYRVAIYLISQLFRLNKIPIFEGRIRPSEYYF